MNIQTADLLPFFKFVSLSFCLICIGGCGGYASPGGVGYMGSGGFYGMGPMGMGMGMGGYGTGPGSMGAGYLGAAYGTGGMEMGTNLGGWGEGTGDDWGHNQNDPSAKIMNNDPHMTSSYHNTDFDNDRGYSFYHPGQPSSTSGPASNP